MKVLFLCPTNPKYMPYLDNYLNILNSFNAEFDILIWDRFCIESFSSNLIFRRGGSKHKRGFLDYYHYAQFVKKHISENSYDKIVCFGLQTAFFIKDILCKKYLNKFILDIRDYNLIKKIYNFEKIISSSFFTVISSQGYTEWLPRSDKYIVNHNFNFSNLSGINDVNKMEIENLSISSIGALRDLEVNMNLISSLKNSSLINLNFHGHGDINDILINKTNGFKNLNITGSYERSEESILYFKSTLINVLRYPDSLNNKTALPNRLYLAPYYGKPLFSFYGTYMSKLIQDYNLGLVVNSFENLEKKIFNYVEDFDKDEFDFSRKLFLNKVIEDNFVFKKSVQDFISIF